MQWYDFDTILPLLCNYHKADDKIFVCNFSKNVTSKLCHIENSKTRERANSVDLDEVAHNEPPHQDLCCLQICTSGTEKVKAPNKKCIL